MKRDDKGRPIRTPLGARNVLTAPTREGYVRRFINDVKDRVQQFMEAGYTTVKDDVQVGDPKAGNATQIGSTTDRKAAGGNIILVEIKEEYYREDQKAKQDKILASENDMKRKINSGGAGNYGGVEIR